MIRKNTEGPWVGYDATPHVILTVYDKSHEHSNDGYYVYMGKLELCLMASNKF